MPRLREDLLPGSAKSQKLVKLIRDHIDMSYRVVSQNFPTWDILERQYRAYRPVDERDRESIDKHNVRHRIIIPIQFATIQTMLTFMMEVFTALKPVLRVRGADPASVRRARVMEVALDYDYRGNRGYFMIQQWFLNAFRYGYGVMKNTWGVKKILKRSMAPGPDSIFTVDGQQFNVPGVMSLADNWLTTFEGNKWEIVDNRAWFPDPRVPIARFQEGSFCGERSQIHDNDLYKMEDDGLFFNTSRLSDAKTAYLGGTRDSEFSNVSHERDRFSPSQGFTFELINAKRAKMHINETIIIELVPKDFELSDEDRPQQWLFNLIDGTTIVRAEPSPFSTYPYAVIETLPDILAFSNQGIMELTQPLSEHLDFLFSSHMANVRKAINDMLLVDPSRVDIRDLLNPDAGKLIRLLPLAYGTDPSAAIKQLQVADVTKGHMEDSRMIMEVWERVTGASNSMFGQISPGRRTALELQGVFRQAGARMKMIADLFSAEGVAPLTEQMAMLRQENMSMPQFMEVAGFTAAQMGVRPEEIIDGFMRVSRDHISGVFSYPAEEGVLPQDRASAAQILEKMFQTVAKAPFLAQIFDPVAIFREMIRQSGLHNIDDFLNKGILTQTSIFSPDLINEYLAANKLIPLDLGGNGGPAAGVGRPDEGVRSSEEGLSLTGAINGAGRPRNAPAPA